MAYQNSQETLTETSIPEYPFMIPKSHYPLINQLEIQICTMFVKWTIFAIDSNAYYTINEIQMYHP